MKEAIDPLSTERYDLDASDIQYEDLQVLARYTGNPNMKFKPMNTVRTHWETQNFLYMAAMQVHDYLKEKGFNIGRQ